MEKKNCFNITIAGKSYTLCGNESNEYLKNVGSYIENKYNSFAEEVAFRSQPMDMQHILMQLNIADDYFKCREELYISKRKYEEQSIELEKLKSSLVAMQVKYENLESGTKLIEKKYQQVKDKLSRLERNER
ncbi:MAG: cell division protein ZapA [Lachnospiraceae bacterium]|nr:cell division protein ZapA [Lachnospiraceae bacterium]MBR4061148.1 cell division protein ZapA [Lachnospiraceae bacterium]